MSSGIDLENVDLVRTPCPHGTKIEIEGLGEMMANFHCENGLLSGIAAVLAMLQGYPVFEDEDFLRRVTLLDLDIQKRSIKVRIAPA